MNFSKASKEQLYQIAVDQTARLSDRYRAAEELKERNRVITDCKCKYPGCVLDATHTWGLVSLCEPHHKIISEETKSYYEKTHGMLYHKRKHFLKIAEQIYWSNYAKGIVN